MSQRLSFVVEGETDAAVLRKLLPKTTENARFFAAGGRASTATVARNLLVHEGGPVMLVADADTHDVHRMQEDRASLQLALRNVAPSSRFGVFLFVPQIEVIFFDSLEAITEIAATSGVPLIDPKYGKAMPKQALQPVLGGQPFRSWLDGLDPSTWELLQHGPQVKELVAAVQALVGKNLVR